MSLPNKERVATDENGVYRRGKVGIADTGRQQCYHTSHHKYKKHSSSSSMQYKQHSRKMNTSGTTAMN